jgi:hypothetical protein
MLLLCNPESDSNRVSFLSRKRGAQKKQQRRTTDGGKERRAGNGAISDNLSDDCGMKIFRAPVDFHGGVNGCVL